MILMVQKIQANSMSLNKLVWDIRRAEDSLFNIIQSIDGRKYRY